MGRWAVFEVDWVLDVRQAPSLKGGGLARGTLVGYLIKKSICLMMRVSGLYRENRKVFVMQNSVSRVECLRQMMHITAFNKGVSHPDVLVISRRLDEAINGLYKVDLIEKDCISEQQPGGDTIDTISLHTVLSDEGKSILISAQKKMNKADKKKEPVIISKYYNISPRQQAIIDFIRDYPHQYSPTVREICTGVGLSSSSTVHSHLIKLEEQGYIVRRANCPRSIELVEN